ncbi:MAG: hypothetical protein KC620_16230, partial [Myxococcales bacterium]|nr:hypothetical protein [Myxococcales bacterium]
VLVVPADAVIESTAAWMAPPAAARPLPETGALVGPEVEFGPAALTLARPARLELPFDPSAVTAQGQDIDHVKVWRVGPDGWQIATPAEPPRADEAVGRVVLETTTLTRFGAGIERP